MACCFHLQTLSTIDRLVNTYTLIIYIYRDSTLVFDEVTENKTSEESSEAENRFAFDTAVSSECV